MKRLKFFFLSSFLLFILFSPLNASTTEDLVWGAVCEQTRQLKTEKRFHEALRALEDYQKQYPKSIHLGAVYLEKADLLLDSLGDIENGFSCLEQAGELGMRNNEQQLSLKERFGVSITEKRLQTLSFHLYKYFLDKLEYPETLDALGYKFPNLTLRDFCDGFGKPFIYVLRSNKVIKGENKLAFDLVSSGSDGVLKTEDDLTFKPQKTDDSLTYRILGFYEEEGVWTADLEYLDKQRRTSVTQKIREGSLFDDYFVFGIAANGVVLVKDNQALVIKRN